MTTYGFGQVFVDDGADEEARESLYPRNWPRCAACGDHALDGHVTCGRVECDEGALRGDRVEPFAEDAP